MFRIWAYVLVLVVIAGAGIRIETSRNPQWAFDGYVYSIMAQVDAGIPYTTARSAARAAYRNTPAMKAPAARYSFNAPYPTWWSLFQPRVLYPWLAAQIWPRARFESLFLVSNAAFAISVVLVFLLLAEFSPLPTAALLAAALALVPEYRLMGRSSLTDMLAFAFWCAALLGMIRYARRGDLLSLGVYAVATTLMCLTRPIPHMALFAVLGLIAFGAARRDRTLLLRAGILAVITIAAFLPSVALAISAHAPGFVQAMADLRATSAAPLESFSQWYWHRVHVTSAIAIVDFATSIVGPIAVAALLMLPRRMESWILLGALLSSGVTILLNPIPSDVERVVILPMLPVVGCAVVTSLRLGSHPGGASAPCEDGGKK